MRERTRIRASDSSGPLHAGHDRPAWNARYGARPSALLHLETPNAPAACKSHSLTARTRCYARQARDENR